MKKFFVLSMVILGLTACSSADKENMGEQADDAAAKTESAAETKADAAKTDATESMGSKTSCTLDKDTRVIEVKKTDTGGCELFYTKFGEAKSVATSGFGTQYCEEVKDRIQTNLNKAGFACQ